MRGRGVSIRVHQQLGAHVGHVAPREAVHHGDREDAVAALQCDQPVDIAACRLLVGPDGDDHLAVDHCRHGRDASLHLRRAQVHQLQRPLADIGVRIFLVGHQDVGMRHHGIRQVAVRIQLGADHHAGANQRAHAGEQVALAVRIAVRHHGAVQAQHHHVDRQRALQVAEQLVA